MRRGERQPDATWARFEAALAARGEPRAQTDQAPGLTGRAGDGPEDAVWTRFEAMLAARAAADAGDARATPAEVAPRRRSARMIDLRGALRGAAAALALMAAAGAGLTWLQLPPGQEQGPLALASTVAPPVVALRPAAPVAPSAASGAASGAALSPAMRVAAIAEPPQGPRVASPAPDAPPRAATQPAAVEAAAPHRSPGAPAQADASPVSVARAPAPVALDMAPALDTRPAPSPLTAAAAEAFVVLHHPAADGERAARAAAMLREAGVEQVVLRPVPLAVTRTQVRYFFDEDRAAAEAVRAFIEAEAPRVSDFTHYRPSPAPKALEIWLSSAAG